MYFIGEKDVKVGFYSKVDPCFDGVCACVLGGVERPQCLCFPHVSLRLCGQIFLCVTET